MKNLQLCLKRKKHKEKMKDKAENIDLVGILAGLGYRITAPIYPLDAVVTNPMLKSARELRVMSETCLVETAVGAMAKRNTSSA